MTALDPRGTLRDVIEFSPSRPELLRHRNLYQGTLDALSAHVAVIDGDGSIVAVNGAWLRFARQNEAHHIGIGDNYLTVCDAAAGIVPEAASTAAALRQILAGERGSYESEYSCHAPAEERWFSLRATAHRSEGPTRVVVEHVNITDRVVAERGRRRAQRELARTRSQLTAVTESMGEAVVGVNQDGEVVSMNSAAEQLLRWPRAELAGRMFHAETHRHDSDGSDYSSEESPVDRAGRDNCVVRVDEDLLLRRDGTTVWASYTVTPFDTEEPRSGSVIVLQDITAQWVENSRLQAEIDSLSMIGEVRDALDENRMELFAQPIVHLNGGATAQHELLIRMRGRDGVLLAPPAFLPIAERYGYMRRIDCWVVDQAADLLAAGHAVEINLSASSLGDRELMDRFEWAHSRPGVEPGRLVVEITETALVEGETTATAFMGQIAAMGYKIALDDFGTGYGSFTYLKNLPVDYLKVDREFIRDIATSEASLHVTKAVVSLAHSFGLAVVAEGVEDEGTAEIVRGLGVELAQGFGIGRPVPLHEAFPD